MAITEKQRAERVNYIGSSDAAAVLGLSRWSTPLEIWAVKTGQIDGQKEETLPMKLGNRLEEVVAELFTEQTGLKVRRANETIFHADHPFLAANIDRAVVGEDAILECKTSSAWKAKEWAGEEIPQEYIIQCNHALAVTGKKRCYLAVLVGNQDFKVKTIDRDEELLKALVDKEVLFWTEFVERNVMPVQITARDNDVLFRLFPDAQPSQIDLGDEVASLIEQRNASIQDLKQCEKNVDTIEAQIKAKLGTNEVGTAGKYIVKWSTQSQVRLDTNRIKTEQPELYRTFGTEVKFRKMTIKEVKRG